MANTIQALVLAAGKSSRFNTTSTKLSFTLCGQEMIMYPLTLLKSLGIHTTVIVGHQKEAVIDIIKKRSVDATCIEQTAQRGTGHAVLCTQSTWHTDTLLILNGDAPLIKAEHIQALINAHRDNNATISFIGTYNADPSVTGYGRIISSNGRISIVEQKEFTGDPSQECHLNAGIYLINRSFLEAALPKLQPHGQGELYITDLIKHASEHNHRIEIVDIPFDYARGVNTLKELWIAEHIMKSDLILEWMNKGVRFTAPQSVSIDASVTIGPDSCIGYGVQLRNGTTIARGVSVDAFSILDNAQLHDNVHIYSHSVVSNAQIHAECHVGPFAHVHKESILKSTSVVGNFVEVSKSTLGKASKAKHLAYLGQAHVGEQVNIGAGVITCNYNGVSKHTTTIESNAFIGSNSALVAPVIIGEGAIVAAGSTITYDVPAQALAIAREQQVNKEQYAERIREKQRAKKEKDPQTFIPGKAV